MSDFRTPEVPRDLAQQALGEGVQHYAGRTAVGAATGGSHRHLLTHHSNALARHASAEPRPRYLSSTFSENLKFDLSYNNDLTLVSGKEEIICSLTNTNIQG